MGWTEAESRKVLISTRVNIQSLAGHGVGHWRINFLLKALRIVGDQRMDASSVLCQLGSELLCHAHDGQRFAVGEGQVDALLLHVAVAAVERDAGEGGSHFEAGKAFGLGGLFA